MRRTILVLALMVGCGVGTATGIHAEETASDSPFSRERQLDLNRASIVELHALPVPPEVADAIHDRRRFEGFFVSVFDLMTVEGMTPELLQVLKPVVFVTPVFQLEREELREDERRSRELYYVLQRLLSEEGASEGAVDAYIDRLRHPDDINGLSFYDLISFQNVSPVDAVAVLREREMAGRIENQRQLRSANGITYWGYRNLRDFVVYQEPEREKWRLSGNYQFRIYNTPYLLDDEDNLTENIQTQRDATGEELENIRNFDLNTYAGRLDLNTSDPFLTNKLYLRYGPRFRAGVITHRNMGEQNWYETTKWYLQARDFKPTGTPLGDFTLHDVVVGNYGVSFGQGLLMASTDFFMPRRTGFGYNVRPIGMDADMSRSDEYTLKGGAVEASLGRVWGTLFYSRDDKDAILNPDGSFNSYFTGVPRISNDLMGEISDDIADGVLVGDRDTTAYYPMRDVMDEQVYGGNLKYEFVPGTYVGVTGVEMRYHNNVFNGPTADRWDPSAENLVLDSGRLEPRDSEIAARYNSLGLGNYRRLWGGEAQTVYKNVSVAAEYGKLEVSDDSNALKRIFSAGPESFVANAYLQYENFNFLTLYRDYDVGYDNPYNRAFSQDSRYEQTIVDGNPYRLRNPYWAFMGMGEPQPKAERGWYFGTRYQFTRQFTLTGLEYDTWTRVADGADLKRVTIRAEYRPIFPLRFRIRHRISSRHEQRADDIRQFKSWDTRLEMRVYLSHYDRLNILYSTSNVQFATRPRLSGNPDGGNVYDNEVGTRGIPSRAIQASLQHNFSNFLTATLSTQIYDGFLYNFEDNEFIVVDGVGYRNWFMLRSRLSEHMSWRFKWTQDHQMPHTYVDFRNFGDLVEPTPDATNARLDRNSYRFQLDYSF